MEKTAIQQVFSELENLHPHLFNIYSTEGREFVNHFHKFLEVEKKQIIDAVTYGQNNYTPLTNTDKEIAENYYYNTFKK